MFAIIDGNFKKVFYRAVVCLLLAVFITVQGSVLGFGNAYADEGKADISSKAVNVSEGLISINMVNADVRDILSTLALKMDVSIIYLGNPVKVSFSAEDVTPEKALELLIQSIGTTGGQLGYIKDGKVIIIGSQEKLQKDFFNQMALTRFKVSYISPKVLSEQLEKLSIPVVKITLDKSSSFIWVQGTAQALSKVASVISALDKRENFNTVDGSLKSSIDLKPITLDYMTAEQLEKLILKLKIEAQTVRVDSNPMVLWVNGSSQALLDINQLVMQVDIPQSAGKAFTIASYRMKYLTYDKLISLANQLDFSVLILKVGTAQKLLWLQGDQNDINDMISFIAKIDIPGNGEEYQFKVYTIKNISPEDAATEIAFLNIPSISTMTLNYPNLSHELLIKCPSDMIEVISKVISTLDVPRNKIKVPIDYADSTYQLTKRRELLNKILDIPLGNMIISDNVSRNGNELYYVMWVEDTPENIKRIKEMIALIDNP